MTIDPIQALRDERDSWLQAGREIEVLMQAAHDNDQSKVVKALRLALMHTDSSLSTLTTILNDMEAK